MTATRGAFSASSSVFSLILVSPASGNDRVRVAATSEELLKTPASCVDAQIDLPLPFFINEEPRHSSAFLLEKLSIIRNRCG